MNNLSMFSRNSCVINCNITDGSSSDLKTLLKVCINNYTKLKYF